MLFEIMIEKYRDNYSEQKEKKEKRNKPSGLFSSL